MLLTRFFFSSLYEIIVLLTTCILFAIFTAEKKNNSFKECKSFCLLTYKICISNLSGNLSDSVFVVVFCIFVRALCECALFWRWQRELSVQQTADKFTRHYSIWKLMEISTATLPMHLITDYSNKQSPSIKNGFTGQFQELVEFFLFSDVQTMSCAARHIHIFCLSLCNFFFLFSARTFFFKFLWHTSNVQWMSIWWIHGKGCYLINSTKKFSN